MILIVLYHRHGRRFNYCLCILNLRFSFATRMDELLSLITDLTMPNGQSLANVM